MQRAVIYPTMWQPVLTAGVPREYALVAVVVAAVCMAIGTLVFGSGLGSRIGAVAVFAIMWAIGWFLALMDPEFFSVFLSSLRLGRTKGSENGNVYYS